MEISDLKITATLFDLWIIRTLKWDTVHSHGSMSYKAANMEVQKNEKSDSPPAKAQYCISFNYFFKIKVKTYYWYIAKSSGAKNGSWLPF